MQWESGSKVFKFSCIFLIFQVEWPKPDKDNVVHMDWYVCTHLYDRKRMLKLGTRTILYKYIHVLNSLASLYWVVL